ncbi:MAG TPA: class I SAM-dependent methyltransferase [Candidatus Angelobacter sp.]|nr:class I SAM-dependent methyltransferase [Candidatus Angelobacter sp.]
MNAYENWFCGSAIWRYVTRRQLLPWLVHGTPLGDHILELGAGRGAATLELAKLAPQVTSLEYDHKSVEILRARAGNLNVRAIRGDASALPFADASFSSAIAILMLHHLQSQELQDRAFSEIYRVLRPGGAFIAFEIRDGWFHRVGHIKSTFVPVDSSTAPARLAAAGFSRVTIDIRSGGFRLRAFRAPQS